MIKALLFDFGGVFIESPFVVLNDVAKEMQVSETLLQSITFGDYGKDSDHPWHRLERGETDLETARQGILERGAEHGLETDIYTMFARFMDMERSVRHQLIECLPRWRQQGYQLAIVTNNVRELEGWQSIFPFHVDDVFHTISDSCYLGQRKPSAGIFEHTLAVLNVKPEEAIFLDDFPANVAAAEALGIRSFLVEDDMNAVIHWVESQLSESL